MPRATKVAQSPLMHVHHDNEGVLALFDSEGGTVLWTRTLDTPAGFGIHRQRTYVNSMYGNRILVLNEAMQVDDVVSHPLMNDLHSLLVSDEGLTITSSGVDAILGLGFDGAVRWRWLAGEHGYDVSASGRHRKVDVHRDHRRQTINTAEQTTHCNSAVPAQLDGRDVLLVTLFHQGQLVAVDRLSGRVRILLQGMENPHSLRQYGNGWLVANSRASSVVRLDSEFWIADVIEAGFNWVQDAIGLDEERILIADANHSRFVVWSTLTNNVEQEIRYPDEWKVYQVEVVTRSNEAWLAGLA